MSLTSEQVQLFRHNGFLKLPRTLPLESVARLKETICRHLREEIAPVQRDSQGRQFFFITGRLKELINRGGVKYSPFEIEEVLMQLPGVRIGLAVAFDNRYYGEEVGAYVVPDAGVELTEAQVLAHCRAHMPFTKAPKVVIFGAEAPVTSTGKFQRLRLKDRFAPWADTQFKEGK